MSDEDGECKRPKGGVVHIHESERIHFNVESSMILSITDRTQGSSIGPLLLKSKLVYWAVQFFLKTKAQPSGPDLV